MIWVRIKLWLRNFFIATAAPVTPTLPITVSKSIAIHNKCGKYECKNRVDPRCEAFSCTEHCKWNCGTLACLDIWRKHELAALKIAEERQARNIFDDDPEEYLQ